MFSQIKGKRNSPVVSGLLRTGRPKFATSAAHYYCFSKHRKLTDVRSYTFLECAAMMRTFMREWACLSVADKDHHCKIYKMQQDKHKRKIISLNALKAYNNKPYLVWTA